MLVVPPDQAEIVDTWHVSGLRATGGNDVVVREAFVPRGHTLKLMAGDPSVPKDIYRGVMAQGARQLASLC